MDTYGISIYEQPNPLEADPMIATDLNSAARGAWLEQSLSDLVRLRHHGQPFIRYMGDEVWGSGMLALKFR